MLNEDQRNALKNKLNEMSMASENGRALTAEDFKTREGIVDPGLVVGNPFVVALNLVQERPPLVSTTNEQQLKPVTLTQLKEQGLLRGDQVKSLLSVLQPDMANQFLALWDGPGVRKITREADPILRVALLTEVFSKEEFAAIFQWFGMEIDASGNPAVDASGEYIQDLSLVDESRKEVVAVTTSTPQPPISEAEKMFGGKKVEVKDVLMAYGLAA